MSQLTKEMEAVQVSISRGDYEEAERLFQNTGIRRGSEAYDDVTAILDASLGAFFGNRERVWEAIRAGLACNCRNYELYVMLGNYYLEENLQQAYLCYENALHHCDVEEDREQIQALLDQLCTEYRVSVNRAAFVVLSYDLLEYTRPCIESIRSTVPETAREIIVVDNGSKDGSVGWLREQKDIKLVENEQNMGFPIGCNQGIAAAEADSDIFLLNNDTLMAENTLFWLRMGLYAGEKVGAAGSVSNNVSNYQQVAAGLEGVDALLKFGQGNNIPMKYPYEQKLFLVGFALLIKRSVLDEIGVLDEQFSPGNSEDEDYGLRVVQAGYKNMLCKNSFILHYGHKSFNKTGIDSFRSVLQVNRQKLDRKWGIDTRYYCYSRSELRNQIVEPAERPMKVLDIGCAFGALLGRIRGVYPNTQAYGIELNPIAAKFAASMADVICADVEELQFPWADGFFDYVILGDVLEHLKRPETVLGKVYRVLRQGGHIIVSMPNVKHYSVLLPLITRDEFSYTDQGILDTTHLKMYTSKEIQKLLVLSGFRVESVTHTLNGSPSKEEDKLLNQLVKMMKRPDKNSLLAYQYIMKAVKV